MVDLDTLRNILGELEAATESLAFGEEWKQACFEVGADHTVEPFIALRAVAAERDALVNRWQSQMGEDQESIDAVVDGENVVLMKELIYELAKQRDDAESKVLLLSQHLRSCAESWHEDNHDSAQDVTFADCARIRCKQEREVLVSLQQPGERIINPSLHHTADDTSAWDAIWGEVGCATNARTL